MTSDFIDSLPSVRGRLRAGVEMANLTWFNVGGPADVLFTPADEDDLASFLCDLQHDIPVYPVGIGSNLLVRDGGIEGVVIRLGSKFNWIKVEADARIRAGAAALDVNVARAAARAGIGGLTFLRGIPGTIGGALRMNGGAYGQETKDVFIEAHAIDRKGNRRVLSVEEMEFGYRHCGAPEDLIFTSALFQGEEGDPAEINKSMEAITKARQDAQPVKSRTGGSTFKNPEASKAWQLIDQAGMRGFRVGNAHVSEKHCNFLINDGGATAAQIEDLGEMVRARVLETSGVELHWEIERVGRHAPDQGSEQD